MTPWGRRALALLAAVSALPISTISTASAADDPLQPAAVSVTVTPTTGLLDGQTVSVEGAGLGPSEPVTVLECAGGQCQAHYRGLPSGSAAEDGTFHIEEVVSRLLPLGGTTYDCATPATCTIQVSGWQATPLYATVPIQFDPSVPPPAPPSITVTPNTGLVDGQTVSVTAQGFARQYYTVTLQECRADAVDFDGCASTPLVGGRGDSFTLAFAVHRYLDLASGRVDCAAAGACAIKTDVGYPEGQLTSAPIQFAAPASVVDVAPSFTG